MLIWRYFSMNYYGIRILLIFPLPDWNLEPSENPLVDAVSHMNGWLLAVYDLLDPSRLKPTLWDGNRTVDYAITNRYRSEYAFSCYNADSHGVLRKVNS